MLTALLADIKNTCHGHKTLIDIQYTHVNKERTTDEI